MQCHAGGDYRGDQQAQAHHGRAVNGPMPPQAPPHPRLEGAPHGAEKVSQVIGAGQPARPKQIDIAVVQHHRKQRREREAPDTHGHGQGHHAGQRDLPG